MSIEHRDSIYQAEALRVAGKLPEALEQVKDSLINPEIIPVLPDQVLSDYIRKWRIWTVTGMSMAQKKWLAGNARDALLAVKPIFTTYYHHPEVEIRSRNYLQDNEGHLYDHRAEMLRDEGKYWLVAYSISGNTIFLNHAEISFEHAVSSAVLDSPKGIAMIELGAVKRRQNELRKRPKGSIYETYIHHGFHQALDTVVEFGDQDRLKWLLIVTRTEGQLAHGNKIAEEDIEEIDQILNSKLGLMGARKLISEHDRKMITSDLHGRVWALTRLGVDFSQIPLPNY